MTTTSKQWEKTDSTQFANKINENTYEYVEALRYADDLFEINHGIVDITDYEENEIVDYIKTFGYDSIEKVKELYGEEYKQILCECIFEVCSDFQHMTANNMHEIIETMKSEFNIVIEEDDF